MRGNSRYKASELGRGKHTAILLFAEYLDAATSMATSSGGGGNSDSNGWGRNKDEDDREWARRFARKANRWSSERRAKLGQLCRDAALLIQS